LTSSLRSMIVLSRFLVGPGWVDSGNAKQIADCRQVVGRSHNGK
jgi:hypothetical protein